tara:strand:- start:1487 stop:2725 length:1239 start_codon:yes stop_codon:yes gene_type:complete
MSHHQKKKFGSLKGRGKTKKQYICYTGIGSNKTGTHTAKDFLKRMEKNRNNFNEPTSKSVKTLDQWVKNSGASYGKCKTKKKPFKLSQFKLTPKQIKKDCRKGCNETEKQMPLMMKALGLNKKEIKEKMKTYKKDCEKNCIRLMGDEKLIKKLLKMKLKGGCGKRGGGKKLSQSEFKKLISEKEKEYWDEMEKCNRKCNTIKTNYAKNKKNLKTKSKCHKKCNDKRLKNIQRVHKKYPKEFKTFVKNLDGGGKKKKTLKKSKLGSGVYLEFRNGSSRKFWRIVKNRTKLITHYGRIGSLGNMTKKDYGSKVDQEYDKLIKSKKKKGYVEKIDFGDPNPKKPKKIEREYMKICKKAEKNKKLNPNEKSYDCEGMLDEGESELKWQIQWNKDALKKGEYDWDKYTEHNKKKRKK